MKHTIKKIITMAHNVNLTKEEKKQFAYINAANWEYLEKVVAKNYKTKQEINKENALQIIADKKLHVWEKLDVLHNRFGFCFAGIREFCEHVGIDNEKQYTVKELKEAAKAAGLDANYKYYRELHRINVL